MLKLTDMQRLVIIQGSEIYRNSQHQKGKK